MTDFCVNCCNKEDDLICSPCHHKTLKIYENKLIEEFLKSWEVLLKWCNDVGFDYEMHKGNIKNYIIQEIEKWEAKLKE